jgi:hypothetical protein
VILFLRGTLSLHIEFAFRNRHKEVEYGYTLMHFITVGVLV